jgi:4-diphosphocytidyl-2-C-methyl-D-erythritol kinase
MPVVRLAPAKVNLYLHVTGRRADGYHLLDSLVAFADIADRVEVASTDRLNLEIDGPFAAALSTDADNLVLKAARLLAEAAGRDPRVRIRLTKNLPVAAGLGGGSADAAAALKALLRLWRIPRSRVALERIAEALGADVPVCLEGGVRYLSGIGERIEPAPPLPPAGLVLVNPNIALPTKRVFERFHGRFSEPARLDRAAADAIALAHALARRRNDLTEAAEAAVPEIARVLAALRQNSDCLIARMSGSGASVFALYADPPTADRAAQRLRTAAPGWWIAAGRFR